MKRFFIFAAMLMTLSSGATQLPDEPPLILPGVEDVVLTPTGMHDDIDRSITRCICQYEPAMHSLTFTCIGTGNCTEIFLADANGVTVDYPVWMPNMTPAHLLTYQAQPEHIIFI